MPVTSRTLIDQALALHAPFCDLPACARNALARDSRASRVARGEMVLHRGDRPSGCFLVAKGAIKLSMSSSNGTEKIIRIVDAGSTFCEDNILTEKTQILAAQATSDALIVLLPRTALKAAMGTNTDFARALMTILSDRMSELIEGMEQCIQRNSTQRVAHYLVQHAEKGDDNIEVRLDFNKQTIASQLNLTPETFSRVLSRLTREGCILSHGRRSITLTDLPSLQSMAA